MEKIRLTLSRIRNWAIWKLAGSSVVVANPRVEKDDIGIIDAGVDESYWSDSYPD